MSTQLTHAEQSESKSAPKPPQKRILDIALGGDEGRVGEVDRGETVVAELTAQRYM